MSKFCSKCGNEIMDEAVICPKCGCAVADRSIYVNKDMTEDTVNVGFVLLSLFVPIVGVILWPVKYKETPKAATVYGICGIVSWILSLIVIFTFVFIGNTIGY